MEKIRKNIYAKTSQKGIGGMKLNKLNKQNFSIALMIDQRVSEVLSWFSIKMPTTIPGQLVKKLICQLFQFILKI